MSETICSIRIFFWWDSHWMVLFQKCGWQFGPSTKMTPTAELSLTYDPKGNSHKNLLLRNHRANCNKTWMAPFQNCVQWSWLPTKMATKLKIEKRVKNWKKIFSSETTEPISTKLCWNDPWVVLFQIDVWHFRPPTKMATTAELNLT